LSPWSLKRAMVGVDRKRIDDSPGPSQLFVEYALAINRGATVCRREAQRPMVKMPDPLERLSRIGLMRFVNLLVFATLVVGLLASIILRDSATTTEADLITRVVALGCVATLLYLSVVLGHKGNGRLLPTLAVLCVVAELAIRAVGTLVVSDVDWREPKPYFMFSGPAGKMIEQPSQMGGKEADRQTRFNAEGFRIEGRVLMPKPADEIRIFVVGGSTVVNGVPLANTIPGVIEEQLRSHGLAGARVYNFGVVSFASGQELSLLVHRLLDLAPDLIVAYDGGNDLSEPWFYDPRPGYPFNFAAWELALEDFSRNSLASKKTVASVADDSALLQALLGRKERALRIALDDQRRIVNYGTSEWKQEIVEIYARNIGAMCRISRSNDILFAAYFQPILPFSPHLDRRQLAMSGGEEIVRNLRGQREAVPGAVSRTLPAPPVGSGCHFDDLSGMFEQQGSERFWDYIHVDNQGNLLIGRRIAEDLLAWDPFSRLHQH
jgi:lysophospholipase L1-like esterase